MLHLLHHCRRRVYAGLATATLIAVPQTPGWAGACSDDIVAAIGKRKGLFAETLYGEWTPVSQWLDDGSVRRFAYVGRFTDEAPDREGAVVVRISRLRLQQADPAAKLIGLRRPDAAPTCGKRAFRAFGYRVFGWTGLDFVGGQKVRVDTFIAHHLADQDVSSVITGFHIDYRSLDDGCVSTQKNQKGRRTAFLAEADGDAMRAVPTVAKKLAANLGIGPAVGAEAKPGTQSYAQRMRREQDTFSTYGAVETQIHTYPLDGERMCVSFTPSRAIEAAPGTRWSIAVVDLDEPGKDPRRSRFNFEWR